MSEELVSDLVRILRDVLRLGARADLMDSRTPLLGAIPEFDSVAVVAVVTALEENFGIAFEDDEIRAEVFETVGSLAGLVEAKLAQ